MILLDHTHNALVASVSTTVESAPGTSAAMMEGELSKRNVSEEAATSKRPTVEELKAKKIVRALPKLLSLDDRITSFVSSL